MEQNRANLRRVAVDPVTRVEGHGKITLLLDDANHVREARFHIVEFRGFEKFIQGRPYWEVPYFVQRLCGICPVSHHLAAAKAVDQLVGVDELTPTATKLRKLLHFGQTMQSHALHFFHLSSPDLLFGFGSNLEHRNIVGVIEDYPDLALKGVRLRKYGQQVIEVISGKRVHGAATVPGGVNKGLTIAERDRLLGDINDVLAWSQDAVDLNEKIHTEHPENHGFGRLNSNYLSMVGGKGELELYHGGLRASRPDGSKIFDQFDYRGYYNIIREEVRSWSYMKFPYLTELGRDDGWYRVGPLARINSCDFISTPMAESARQRFKAFGNGGYVHDTLAYHWARMIEVLHSAEAIRDLLLDPEILGSDLVVKGEKREEGIGVIEAPRGTLFHHYKVNEDGTIKKANLIVSTTSNNQAMNESVRSVANEYLDGNEITEGLLNHLEVAIRAYDPCLSCATHALGKMPLEVELISADGETVDHIEKASSGAIKRTV
ncbi:NAD(P)-dependent nickel-iron dehydrogenase catalytic subunit [Mariprofundus aestuarium]|uniref:NAD(P)-dependent nickel-iron dehydrogenase catalytic subunit n=1 Tax=Mariprofundus aestuarium TaxID=1921086 RepID=A0A2K8KVZ5_MARES|nr:Ni/Fe hydrogenase subunit alpha [Mariprofundus aestuarium]ATX79010.1 NAD(P)-dependent nickel-iron dehydrogenase catalytic subunit [Mariprofundus aestuarium]